MEIKIETEQSNWKKNETEQRTRSSTLSASINTSTA